MQELTCNSWSILRDEEKNKTGQSKRKIHERENNNRRWIGFEKLKPHEERIAVSAQLKLFETQF